MKKIYKGVQLFFTFSFVFLGLFFASSKIAAAATFTWTGGAGADSNWTTAENWGGTAPSGTGTDDLVFPDGGARMTTSNNNFTAATSFNSIQFSGTAAGYTVSGNQITLGTGGISSVNTSATNTISFAVILGATRTITVSDAAGTLEMSGIISGSGGLTKAGPGKLTVSGTNTFTGGLIIQAGTVKATTSNKALGGATGTGTVTIGDTSGSANATLLIGGSFMNYANPIVLATGTTGTLTVGYESASTNRVTLSGGVTGTNNLIIKNNNTSSGGILEFSTASINNIGTITNSGSSSASTEINGGVGSNVTAITQSSTTSALYIYTNPITVNSGGTTLTNSLGVKALTVYGGVAGTGNLILKNNSSLSGGISFYQTGAPVNNIGTITNSGSGSGLVDINGGVGSNVTAITQSSTTSELRIMSNPITVNSGGTTLTNSLGTKKLTVYGGVAGTGNLILKNNSSLSGGISFSTTSVNNIGTITNSGSGTGSTTTMGGVGSNVTAITQSSTTSALTISTNPITVNSGGTTLTNSLGGNTLTVSGGVAGTGNLILNNNSSKDAGISFSTTSVNNIGTITNSGSGTGTIYIAGGVGSNVTAITQSSTTLQLYIYTNPITVNSGGTTLTNSLGGNTLEVHGGVVGTGNLILNNNSSLAGGITLATTSVNNAGTITNSGTGTGTTVISSVIGTNVTGVAQSSTNSTLTLSNTNTFTTGVTLNSGKLNVNAAAALGTVAGTLTINGGTIDNSSVGAITTNNYPISWNGDVTFTGTQNLNLGTGTVTMGADSTVTVNGGTLTLGSLSGLGFKLTKAGIGTLTFANGSTISVGSVNISGGTLNGGNNSIAVSGTGASVWTSTGTFSSTGTVTMNGATPQIGSSTFNNLIITNSATFTGSTTVSGTFTDTTAGSTLTFNSGSTYAFANLSITGTTGNNVVMTSGGTWFLNVTQVSPTISNVAADHSDATGGNTISATDHSRNNGNNVNWSFPPTISDAPIIGTATRGSGEATVTFSVPGFDGGGTITGYTVTSSPAGGTDSNAGSTSLSHIVTGLTNGSPYTFTVTATNSVGTSASSSASNSVTPAAAPDAPIIGTATRGSEEATVTFTTPGFDGGATITGYTVTSSPAGGTDSNAGSTSLSHTITGLTNGTAYTFTVTATNSVGTSASSSASNGVTPATVPDAPTIGTATRGAGQATVTFSVPGFDGGATITGYTVTSSPAGGTDSNAGSTSLSHTITGLTNGTAYTFTVTATNVVGTSTASAASNSATPTTVPDAPIIGSATGGIGEATVTFSAPGFTGGTAVTGYTVISSPAGGTDSNAGSTSLSHTMTGLTNGTAYTFTVTATNVVGTSASSSASNSVTPTTVPDAPIIGTATRGSEEATVTFSAPEFNGGATITGYTVTSSPAGGIDSNAGSTSLSHTMTGLTNGTAYTFTVTTTNSVGTSGSSSASNVVTPATVPDAPTIGTATRGASQATVTFSAPEFNGGTVITGYTVTSSPAGGTDSNAGSTSLSHTITGLTNGTSYTFTVGAMNTVGTSGSSSASNVVAPATIPDAPVNPAATVEDHSIDLAWSTPFINGGSAIIDYVIEYKLSTAGVWSVFPDEIGTANHTLVTSLANNNSYDFRVSAVNDVGQGTSSIIVTAAPGSPAQVLIRGFSSLIVPGIATDIRITNEGATAYEYQYTWCVTASSNNTCAGGDDIFYSTGAKLIQPGENWDTTLNSTVPSVGNYWFHLNVFFGSDSSTASQTFTTLAAPVTPPTSPTPSNNGGGGGGGGNYTAPSTPPTTDSTHPIIFTDTSTHWAQSYITKLVNKCNMEGYKDASGNSLDKFGPDDQITRAELVKMMVGCKQNNIEATKGKPYSDVELGQWYTPYILVAKNAGWISGYTDNSFKPNQKINRVEALKNILSSDFNTSDIVGGSSNFLDVFSGQWYTKYVNFATLKKFVNGYNDAEGNLTGLFGPGNYLTRGEAAKIIVNAGGY